MLKHVIILSGHVSAGKSTLAKNLQENHNKVLHCKTSEIISELKPEVPHERKAMQEAGERLDRSTGGSWVANGLMRRLNKESEDVEIVIIDSIRIKKQIKHVRRSYGSQKVFHIHLTAPDEVLSARYLKRKHNFQELKNYEEVMKNLTEQDVKHLEEIADAVVDTNRCTPEDVLIKVQAHLGLYPRTARPLVDVMVGGQYGSEGKGNIAAHIAPEYDYLVRVGGPNAGHKVYNEPNHLVFRHIPSGTTSNANSKVILGPGAIIDVDVLLKEIATFDLDVDRLIIDPQATIINDFDKLIESRKDKIGSTRKGVGVATSRRILARLKGGDGFQCANDIGKLKPYIHKTCDLLEDAYQNNSKVLLEGTQGTGLSLYHGIYPYVTSRDTTVAGCLAEAGIAPMRVRKIILVIRTYPIRVGGPSGPMSKFVSRRELHRRSGISIYDLSKTEKTTVTNKPRRIGEFDWCQLRSSSILNGPTDIALTFVDYLDIANRKARRFEQLKPETINFIEEIERVSGAPVSLISTRFDYRNIIDRRAW